MLDEKVIIDINIWVLYVFNYSEVVEYINEFILNNVEFLMFIVVEMEFLLYWEVEINF